MKNDNEKHKDNVSWHDKSWRQEWNVDSDVDFLTGIGWLRNFMKNNGLSLQKRISISQKDADKLDNK